MVKKANLNKCAHVLSEAQIFYIVIASIVGAAITGMAIFISIEVKKVSNFAEKDLALVKSSIGELLSDGKEIKSKVSHLVDELSSTDFKVNNIIGAYTGFESIFPDLPK